MKINLLLSLRNPLKRKSSSKYLRTSIIQTLTSDFWFLSTSLCSNSSKSSEAVSNFRRSTPWTSFSPQVKCTIAVSPPSDLLAKSLSLISDENLDEDGFLYCHYTSEIVGGHWELMIIIIFEFEDVGLQVLQDSQAEREHRSA